MLGNLGEEEISKAIVLFDGVGLGEALPDEELDVELEDELVELEVDDVLLVFPEVLSGIKTLPELLEEEELVEVDDVLLVLDTQLKLSAQIFGFVAQHPFTQQLKPHMENEHPPPPPPVDVEVELVVEDVEPEEELLLEVVDEPEEDDELLVVLPEDEEDVEPLLEVVVQRLLIEQV